MNVSLNTFYDALSDIMKAEIYNSSYADFTYTSLKKSNTLLEAIKSYDKANPFYKEYNATNPYGVIKDIRNSYCSEQMISNEDGSRGCYHNGLYNIGFTIMFNTKSKI